MLHRLRASRPLLCIASVEFTAKPGSCPSAHGLYPRSEDCESDMDCPGWQKCCQRSGRSLCSDPAS
uniref:WAP domain-containing protein n=1 Tax=Sander lucioperca TaxID=283035 RepID=A0A8D0D6P4_SANLU